MPSYSFRKKVTPPRSTKPSTITREHHIYHNDSGGVTSSPFFWMWLMDRPQQPTVQVQQAPAPVAQAPVAQAPATKPESGISVISTTEQKSESSNIGYWVLGAVLAVVLAGVAFIALI